MNRGIYHLRSGNNEEHTFEIDLKRADHEIPVVPQPSRLWTQLAFQRCTNCPLDPTGHTFCPPALDIIPLAEPFTASLSIDRVDVWVHTAERSSFKNCVLQTA